MAVTLLSIGAGAMFGGAAVGKAAAGPSARMEVGDGVPGAPRATSPTDPDEGLAAGFREPDFFFLVGICP